MISPAITALIIAVLAAFAFSSGLHLTTGGWHRIQQLNSNNALLSVAQ